MPGRTKRINLKDIPGAEKNQVKWLMSAGVATVKDAKKAAKAFIEDLEDVKCKQAKKRAAKGKS